MFSGSITLWNNILIYYSISKKTIIYINTINHSYIFQLTSSLISDHASQCNCIIFSCAPARTSITYEGKSYPSTGLNELAQEILILYSLDYSESPEIFLNSQKIMHEKYYSTIIQNDSASLLSSSHSLLSSEQSLPATSIHMPTPMPTPLPPPLPTIDTPSPPSPSPSASTSSAA